MPSVVRVIVGATYLYGKAFLLGLYVFAYLVGAQLLSPTQNLFRVKKREVPPKCLHDEAAGQHGYISVKGLRFHYVEKGDRNKPLMLFVHGFPEFWYSWRHQMSEFCKDYWTVAIDLRGYGDSDKPKKMSDYKTDLLVDDVRGIVTALGRKKFILVAHDWGGVLAWLFVDKYPEMVEKYIIMNGPHPKVHRELLKSKKQSSMSWYMVFFQLPLLPELYVGWKDLSMIPRVLLAPKKSNPYITEEDIEAFKYNFSKPGALTYPINFYRAAMWDYAIGNHQVKESKGERPPGLYIFGAKDMALDVANVPKHKEIFSNLETVIIQEGNHFIQQDEPKAVNNAMKSFLKSVK